MRLSESRASNSPEICVRDTPERRGFYSFKHLPAPSPGLFHFLVKSMTTVQRYDRGELKSAVRTDEGYVLAEGFAARPGVLEYQQADGSIRRELVPEEELHRAESLETLARKPVTLEHPKADSGEQVFVAPENVQAFGVGDVSEEVEVVRLGGFVKIRMAVRRADAIEAIDRGIRELSAGYTVDRDADR